MKLRSFAAALVLLSGLCSAAPDWYSPPKGDAERAQIMDALRAELGSFDPANRDLVFVVSELCVSSSAGWLSVEPQSRDGKNHLEPVHAVLKRGKSGWLVERLACGEEECPKGTDPEALRAKIKPRCK